MCMGVTVRPKYVQWSLGRRTKLKSYSKPSVSDTVCRNRTIRKWNVIASVGSGASIRSCSLIEWQERRNLFGVEEHAINVHRHFHVDPGCVNLRKGRIQLRRSTRSKKLGSRKKYRAHFGAATTSHSFVASVTPEITFGWVTIGQEMYIITLCRSVTIRSIHFDARQPPSHRKIMRRPPRYLVVKGTTRCVRVRKSLERKSMREIRGHANLHNLSNNTTN